MTGRASDRRLGALRPKQLDAEQLALYRTITEGPRAGDGNVSLVDPEGRLQGPFDAMLRSPHIGEPLQHLGAALRYRSSLPPRAREMVILAVAAAEDSAFERFAHESIGRAEGLNDQDLTALRTGGQLPAGDPIENAALAIARALLTDNDLDDHAYRSAVAAIGERHLFEVITLVGYYRALALQLRVFRIGLPEVT